MISGLGIDPGRMTGELFRNRTQEELPTMQDLLFINEVGLRSAANIPQIGIWGLTSGLALNLRLAFPALC